MSSVRAVGPACEFIARDRRIRGDDGAGLLTTCIVLRSRRILGLETKAAVAVRVVKLSYADEHLSAALRLGS